MTQKEREDRFIEKCRKDFKELNWESEQLLRFGYSSGAAELGRVAYVSGQDAQRERVLDALGAVASKETALP